MSFLRAIQWFHSHADPIWPDGTFKYFPRILSKYAERSKNMQREILSFRRVSKLYC
jgi:hypothetical protein